MTDKVLNTMSKIVSIESKVINTVGKFLFIPTLFLYIYIYVMFPSEKIVNYIGYKINVLYGFIYMIIISSIIAFIITFILHIISTILWSSKVFEKWFKITNLIYIYFSGLGSMIDVTQPLLIKEGIMAKEYNIDYKSVFIVFFIALTNYSFYDYIVFSNKIFDFDNMIIILKIKGFEKMLNDRITLQLNVIINKLSEQLSLKIENILKRKSFQKEKIVVPKVK